MSVDDTKTQGSPSSGSESVSQMLNTLSEFLKEVKMQGQAVEVTKHHDADEPYIEIKTEIKFPLSVAEVQNSSEHDILDSHYGDVESESTTPFTFFQGDGRKVRVDRKTNAKIDVTDEVDDNAETVMDTASDNHHVPVIDRSMSQPDLSVMDATTDASDLGQLSPSKVRRPSKPKASPSSLEDRLFRTREDTQSKTENQVATPTPGPDIETEGTVKMTPLQRTPLIESDLLQAKESSENKIDTINQAMRNFQEKLAIEREKQQSQTQAQAETSKKSKADRNDPVINELHEAAGMLKSMPAEEKEWVRVFFFDVDNMKPWFSAAEIKREWQAGSGFIDIIDVISSNDTKSVKSFSPAMRELKQFNRRLAVVIRGMEEERVGYTRVLQARHYLVEVFQVWWDFYRDDEI